MISAFIIVGLIVFVAVLIHYEVLYRLSRIIPSLPVPHRFRVLFGVLGALAAHVLEIWFFGGGYYLLSHLESYGELQGNIAGSFADYCYFSFTTFTTLGYGDIHPVGYMRFLAGVESLTGLVLITWSASFMFLEMQKSWKIK